MSLLGKSDGEEIYELPASIWSQAISVEEPARMAAEKADMTDRPGGECYPPTTVMLLPEITKSPGQIFKSWNVVFYSVNASFITFLPE